MRRLSIALLLAGLAAGLAASVPAQAQGDPRGRDERELRRHELRQQLSEERQRWHAQQRGGPGPGGAPPHMVPAQPGWPPGGARLSPEERRQLRQELRRQR